MDTQQLQIIKQTIQEQVAVSIEKSVNGGIRDMQSKMDKQASDLAKHIIDDAVTAQQLSDHMANFATFQKKADPVLNTVGNWSWFTSAFWAFIIGIGGIGGILYGVLKHK